MKMAVEHKIRSGKYCTGRSGSADSFLDLRSEIYYDLIDHRGSMEWNRL